MVLSHYTLSETAIKNFLCKALNIDKYDPRAVRESIEAILVGRPVSENNVTSSVIMIPLWKSDMIW